MEEINEQKKIVLLGNFDGVHRGHLALLARAAEEGKKRSLPVLAYTFTGLPSPPPQLCTQEEKTALLLSGGADEVYTEDFSAVRTLSPEDFVKQILCRRLGAAYAVCGFNFRFGYRASGNAFDLIRLMDGNACSVDAVLHEDAPISSTRIRALLAEGNAEEAALLMGRPYSLTLPVVHGKRIGHTLGFPTANQHIPADRVTPKHGVYVTEVITGDGRTFRGITNIGSRPTVNDDTEDVTCETFIGGLHEDLYGSLLTLRFLSFLREEKRFDSLQALTDQLRTDKNAIGIRE